MGSSFPTALALYEAVFASAPMGNYLLSPTPEATILAVNDAFQKASGRRREDLVGVSVFDAFPGNPDDPEDTGVAALKNSLARVIASGQPDSLPAQRYPILVRGPDGQERYEERFWNAVNTPIFDQEGRLICIFHTTADVTRQVQAEAALRKSEAKYRSLFNSLIEGFCILEMIYDGGNNPVDYRICEANPVFEAQTGLRDAVDKTARELVPGLEDQWFEIYGSVDRTGEPVRFENEAHALGRRFDVYAFRTGEPEDHRVAVLFRDITEDWRAAEKLKASEQAAREAARRAEVERLLLDTVLEAVPVAICVTDAEGGVLRVNAANRRLWGEEHPMPEDTGEYREWKGWWADHTERHGQPLEAREWTLARVLRGEEAPRDIIETETFHNPPRRRVIINSGAAIRDREGRIVGGVVAQMDITDRVKAEAQVQQLNAELEERVEKRTAQLEQSNEALMRSNMELQRFAHAAAHDLQTPLRSIVSFSQLLQQELRDSGNARASELLAVVTDNGKRLHGLIQELLAYSRLDAAARPLEAVDMGEIFDQVALTLATTIKEAGAQVERGPLPTISADRTQMAQLLQNLIENGIKYNRSRPPRVTVTGERRGSEWVFAVADNGMGIEPRHSQRIFEIFRRLHSYNEIPGTGIGLAICQRIVERHGGHIWVESQPGQGSVFYFSLPAGREGSFTGTVK